MIKKKKKAKKQANIVLGCQKRKRRKKRKSLPQASEPVTFCWGCLQQQMHLIPMGFPGLPILDAKLGHSYKHSL